MDSLFTVDPSLCVKCGLCVRDCAFKALSCDSSGFPSMAEPSRCMKCQHCFAVCPKGAIRFDGRNAGDALPTAGLALPKGCEVENWMRVRRSYRHFRQDADVDRALLERILHALGNTPTGCNARALTFTCYPNRAAMAKFKEGFLHTIEDHREGSRLLPRWLAVPAIRMRRGAEDMFFRNATGMVIISSDETAPGVTTPNEDVAAACAYFEMLAQANGIATCWCGFLKLVQGAVPEILEATAGIRRTTPFYAMLFGLPAVRYQRGALRDDYAKVLFKE